MCMMQLVVSHIKWLSTFFGLLHNHLDMSVLKTLVPNFYLFFFCFFLCECGTQVNILFQSMWVGKTCVCLCVVVSLTRAHHHLVQHSAGLKGYHDCLKPTWQMQTWHRPACICCPTASTSQDDILWGMWKSKNLVCTTGNKTFVQEKGKII